MIIRIRDPFAKLGHAEGDLPAAPRESAAQAGIVAARFFEILVEAIEGG